RSHPSTIRCWTGTSATGCQRRHRILCWRWPHVIAISGKPGLLTTTFASYVRVLSDTRLLGHEPFRISLRRRRVCVSCKGSAVENARPRGSFDQFSFGVGETFGQPPEEGRA